MAGNERLVTGAAPSTPAIATAQGVSERYVGRSLRLAGLAPDIGAAVLDRYQPVDLELERLLKGTPIRSHARRRALGIRRA